MRKISYEFRFNSHSRDEVLIEIEGRLWTSRMVKDLTKFITSPRKHPLCIESDPGSGKTFAITNLLPHLYRMLTGRTCTVVIGTPMKLKNTRDLFETSSFESNTQKWVLTWFTSSFIDTTRDLFPVIEEASRIDPDSQNILLDFLEERQSILLQNLGQTITLPANSKVILLANPSGGGVYPLNPAISDRVKTVRWSMPSAETVAKQVFSGFRYDARKYDYQGICIDQRQLDLNTTHFILDSVYTLREQLGFRLSYRMLEKIIDEYVQDSSGFIDFLEGYFRELAEDSDTSEYAIMSELQNLENNLYVGNEYKRTGSGF